MSRHTLLILTFLVCALSSVDAQEPPDVGALPHARGTTFRVWAPFADRVFVVGDFNDWTETALTAEGNGNWSVDLPRARPGQQYRYVILRGNDRLSRLDPRSREVTSSAGNSVIPQRDLRSPIADLRIRAPWNEWVLYEMHVGTFHDQPGGRPGTFRTAIRKLDYLRDLGVNAIEVMPIAEFAGDYSWGYNPASPFAVEGAYGGPAAFRLFVNAAHRRGIAVIVDVVYNHVGPGDNTLWRFDGWHENGKGGIYFYNDFRSRTPWGDRPDFGRTEVRRYFRDNARMWLSEYGADGLRLDSTVNLRTVDNGGGGEIPDGWRLMQEINDDVDRSVPGAFVIAEDLQNNSWITKRTREGGAGFDSQWDAGFVHPVRAALLATDDRSRSMTAVAAAIRGGSKRVIYTESHDEVANGHSRVPEEVWPGHADSWFSRKRSTLGAALVFTAPGTPMIFQGQEFLEDGWFDDRDPLDWSKLDRFPGIRRMYRDLIRLRRNLRGTTAGLTGPHVNVFHVNESDKVLAFHRWARGGAGDDVVVLVNFANRSYDSYRIGFPRAGVWRVRFNADATVYSPDFGSVPVLDLSAVTSPRDGLPASGSLAIGPYSGVILSQEP